MTTTELIRFCVRCIKKSIAILALIAAVAIVIFLLHNSLTGPTFQTLSEAHERERTLINEVTRYFPLSEIPTKGKAVLISVLYPYEWDYVCPVGEMTKGYKAIKHDHQSSIDERHSYDQNYSDDDFGLVFYRIGTQVLFSHILPGYKIGNIGTCTERQQAYLKPAIASAGNVYLEVSVK